MIGLKKYFKTSIKKGGAPGRVLRVSLLHKAADFSSLLVFVNNYFPSMMKALYLMTSAFGNLITLLIVALFSTIGFEQVKNTKVYKTEFVIRTENDQNFKISQIFTFVALMTGFSLVLAFVATR